MNFTKARLAKQARLFGQEAMELIGLKRLCIVGCGRNGSSFATLAAYAGFAKFSLIDPDIVKPHNLNATIPFFMGDIGRLKGEVVKERLKAIDRSIKCKAYPFMIQDVAVSEVLASADIVVDATDSIPAKKFLNARVSENQKKGKNQMLLSLGSGAFVRGGRILQLGAQAALYEEGGACLMCGPLDFEEKTNLSRVSFVAMNVLASVLGLQLLLSSLIGHDRETSGKYNFILYDCLSQQVVKLNRAPREDCKFCGNIK
jgi:molybdopterin/thiamine biosynthesis adenylyltransferase